MDQILVHSEKLNKDSLEVHSVEGKISEDTMNVILNWAKNSTLRIISFFSKNTNKNFHESTASWQVDYFY